MDTQEERKNSGIKPYLPLICGLVSAVAFAIFIISTNMADSTPGTLTEIMMGVWMIFSLLGVISSFITRKEADRHTVLWWVGTVVCFASFVVAVFFFGAIVILASFLRSN